MSAKDQQIKFLQYRVKALEKELTRHKEEIKSVITSVITDIKNIK